MHACKGIWRPDSLPPEATIRKEFFAKFGDVSLKTLGLQLSEDTVARVNGRVARSFDDAVSDLVNNINRLKWELELIGAGKEPPPSIEDVPPDELQVEVTG
jgi:hypothetical protein